MHFRAPDKALRMSSRDHIHPGVVVSKLEGKHEMTLGFIDSLRDEFIENRTRGFFFHSRLCFYEAKGLNEGILLDRNEWRKLIHVPDPT